MTVRETAAAFSRETVEELSAARGEPDWLRDRRLRAWEVYEALPMPTPRDEAWRRTNLSRLKLAALQPLQGASGAEVESPLGLDGATGGRLTHDNADTIEQRLGADPSARGVIFTDLETAVREHPELVRDSLMTRAIIPEYGKFAALNGALWTGGTFLYVPRGVEVALPLHTLYALTGSNAAIFTHTLLVLEPRARATFIEEYASPRAQGQGFNAGVGEYFLGQAAHLTFVTLQEWMGDVYDLSAQRAVLERDARLDWLVVGMGNGVTRTNIEASLQGAGANVQMLGVLWGYASQRTDYLTVQDHVAPHTTSDLLYKAALTDESRSVFSGKIRVEKGAHGTDAYQTNRSLLLSPHAFAYPSPNLEIEANEVRCSHGASVGKVDQDQLFYLMSRGISRDLATRMIVEGFFADVLAREPAEVVRERLTDLIARKMWARPLEASGDEVPESA